MKILVATRSPHKLAEIRRIMAGVSEVELLDLETVGIHYTADEEDIEAFETFEENARAKARHFHRLSGLPTIADDSGLEVDALEGAPGVRSKRFAPDAGLPESGEERDRANNEHLLRLLGDLELALRTAHYTCVAVLDDGSEDVRSFRGKAPGLIMGMQRGSGGFGYDPLFFDQTHGRTFAELTPEEKNARSHRGKAFRALADHLSYTSDKSGSGT